MQLITHRKYPDVDFVYSLQLNSNVQKRIMKLFEEIDDSKNIEDKSQTKIYFLFKLSNIYLLFT